MCNCFNSTFIFVFVSFLGLQQKYFDSGDYQMAKQKGSSVKQVFANKVTTGEAIPTPETVPIRKTSIIQSCNKYQANTG